MDNTIEISGPYEEVCKTRRRVVDALNNTLCDETMYSFSGKIITDVMEHVKTVPSRFGVHCSVLRINSGREELYIASVAGSKEKRMKACASFEELFDGLKYHASSKADEVVLVEHKAKKQELKKTQNPKKTSPIIDWYRKFFEFEGHIFYVDSIHHSLLPKVQDDIAQLSRELLVNIHVAPTPQLPWIRTGEIAVEAKPFQMAKLRERINTILE